MENMERYRNKMTKWNKGTKLKWFMFKRTGDD